MAKASTRAANDSGDDLWTVPPEKFVAARNALKDPELKKLKRPTPSAWLVNMLVRTQPKEIEALFRAGDALHTAQGRVLAGANPSELHDAMRTVRETVAAAMRRARAILGDHGRKPTPDLTRRVTHTLRSAAIDRRVREVVEQGQLTADPSTDDVSALNDVRVPPRIKAKPEPKKALAKPEPKKALAKPPKEDKQRARKEAAEAREREKLRRAREKEEQQREAEERARVAREARERLRTEAVQAGAALDAAKREVTRLEKELQAARATLTHARATHARAKKRASQKT